METESRVTPISWHYRIRPFGENTTPADRATHTDIADLLIRWRQCGMSTVPEAAEEAPPSLATSTNPVFLEVCKHFGPEHHTNVPALIEEPNLEFVVVTRRI